MNKYKYTAVNLQKQKVEGTFIAENERDLAIQLSKQNLYLIDAKPFSDTTPVSFFSFSSSVKLSDLTTFCRQFAIMLNAGISIVECIVILKAQPYTDMFKKILNMIYDDVKGGVMLSDALKKHQKVFPGFFVNMIGVGEASGKLDLVLTSLADYYETDAAIRKKAKSALSYPIMLLCLMVGIIAAMMLFIIPTFEESLGDILEGEGGVTGISKVVFDMSHFIKDNILYFVAVIVIVALTIFLVGKTARGKYFYHTFAVQAPIVKTVFLNMITARFARGFGLLLASGMDIIDAMDVITVVLGNKYIEDQFAKATEDVRQGMSLTMALDSHKIFPQMMIQMVSIGEKTDSLSDVLNRSCNFFDEQVESSLTKLVSTIQPVMLGIMGGVVGLLFVAIYSPMLTIMTSMTG